MIEDLNELARSMSRYCVGMEGNVSGKVDNEITIKASGSKLDKMSFHDWVVIGGDGTQMSHPSKKPSMELSFHTYLLGFEGVNYVAHTHPVNSLKILCSNTCYTFSKDRIFPDQVVFNGGKSCLVSYAKPGEKLTLEIKKSVELFIKTEGYFPKIILLENHGVIACGKTINECIIATDICEKSAEIFSGVKTLKRLTTSEVEDLMTDEKEKHRISLL